MKKKVTIAVLCLAILCIVSCKKRKSPENTGTSEMSKTNYSEDSMENEDSIMLSMQGRKLTEEEIQKLEEKLQANPEDLMSRIKVLGWYSGKRFTSESAAKARAKHILWIIQNHPDADIAGTPEIYLDPVMDKDTYSTAKDLWLEQIEAQKTNTVVLGNAAQFFLIYDKEIAEDLLKKAQTLEPKNSTWPEQLGRLYSMGLISNSDNTNTELASQALEQFEKSYTITTSDRDKFYKLADLAKMAYEVGDLKKAENYANELLAKATQYKSDWNYGNAIHHGNLILGRIALNSNDIGKAKEYLIKAGNTSGSPQLDSFGPSMTLAKELLEKNEKETVIQYFELCGNFWEMGEDKLKKWTADVKEGRVPDFQANLSY